VPRNVELTLRFEKIPKLINGRTGTKISYVANETRPANPNKRGTNVGQLSQGNSTPPQVIPRRKEVADMVNRNKPTQSNDLNLDDTAPGTGFRVRNSGMRRNAMPQNGRLSQKIQRCD
jgi:hypothetical protein